MKRLFLSYSLTYKDIVHDIFERIHSEQNIHLRDKLGIMGKDLIDNINKDISIEDPLKYMSKMNKLVYQIVIGKTTKYLDECIQSVKDYALRHGYDYECETEIPERHKDKDARMASEWMRLEKLASRPYVLYVDWDVLFRKDFELKDEIITIKTIDTLLYFGPHIDLARKLLNKAIELYGDKNINCFGNYTFVKNIDSNHLKYCLPDNFYKHLVWHISGEIFYK